MSTGKDIYLNELSLSKVESKELALGVMRSFVWVVSALRAYGLGPLRHDISVEYKTIALSTGYYVYSWLNDEGIERELKSRFKSIVTASPLVAQTHKDLLKKVNVSDVYLENERGLGLTAAYNDKSLSVSFCFNSNFNTEYIKAELHTLEGKPQNIRISNISLLNHLYEHIEWVKNEGHFVEIEITNPLPFAKYSTQINGDIYTFANNKSREEQIAIYTEASKKITKINLFQPNSKLSSKNGGRLVFEHGYGSKKIYLALDTQHGEFECHSHDGKGVAVFDFNGLRQIKTCEHTLIVK